MRISVPRRLSRGRSTYEARAHNVTTLQHRPSRVPLDRDADTITLIYELLDAHKDTAEIAQDLCDDPQWAAHLDYLRALQRSGREMLARMPDREARR
jgi:hypothetical protein